MGQPFPILATSESTVDTDIFEAAFRASPEGMAVAEAGSICYANQAFAYFGRPRLSGEPHSASRFLASVRRGIRVSLRNPRRSEDEPKSHLCQFVSKRRDGTPLQIESTCVPFRLGLRELQLITIRDVTVRERRRMVRDGHERFRVIFDVAHMGILQCDLQGFVLESNPAVERMLGYTREELRGRNFHEMAHADGDTAALGCSANWWTASGSPTNWRPSTKANRRPWVGSGLRFRWCAGSMEGRSSRSA